MKSIKSLKRIGSQKPDGGGGAPITITPNRSDLSIDRFGLKMRSIPSPELIRPDRVSVGVFDAVSKAVCHTNYKIHLSDSL